MPGEKWEERPWVAQIEGFRAEILYSRDGKTPLKVTSEGQCPVCREPTRGSQWLVESVAGFLETEDDEATLQTVEMRLEQRRQRGLPPLPSPAVVEQEMMCLCSGEHPDRRPAKGLGCGAYWTLLVEIPRP